MATSPTAEMAAPSGPWLWTITFGSIAVWIVHLTAEACLAAVRERHGSVVWLMHGLTVVLTRWSPPECFCWRLAHRSPLDTFDDEGLGSPAGRTVFLGWLGFAIGALNLLLIVVEGSFIAALST